ncbi:MAG: hypothetical protein O3C34_19615 [Proteobacteria bacterium]|nr:hypothetical protein [Pseudomonadota bacterium]
MSLNDDIKSHAKLVARDVKAGKPSAHSTMAREFMAEFPDAVLGVLDLVHRETNRKKPNEAIVQAYIYMFGVGLEEIRYELERGQEWAEDIVDTVRELLLLLARGGVLPPHLLMLLLNAMIEARLAPGDELTECLGEIALETAEEAPASTLSDLEELYASIVEQAGGNEFEVHAALADISMALPPEFRMAMLDHIMTADNPVLRDTAILYLLDAAPEVRQTVCQLIADHAAPSLISPVAFRRMIAVRNWLPENERGPLDAGIRKCRQQQVDCAAWPKRQVEEILVSNLDGAGAQSIFAVTRNGSKYLIASLLVKQGIGTADAWCLRDQSKGDVRDILGRIQSETDSHRVPLEFLHFLVPHFLAIGQKNGVVPMAGMLDFVEAIGIEAWQPSELTNDALLSLLEQDIDPARFDSAAVAKVIENSGNLLDEMLFLDSWFEQDAVVDAVLAGTPNARTRKKVDAIIKLVLEPRRARWTERFLWTALWLKQRRDLMSPWAEFFVIGRELHRNRPVNDIPIMQGIAEATVQAEMMRF